MSPELLRGIAESYALLAPDLHALTGAFYARLFAVRPDLRGLFEADMTRQQRHLAAALELVGQNLRMMDALEGPLRELGADHARIGVRPEDYPPVLAALTGVLGDALSAAAGASTAAGKLVPFDVAAVSFGWGQILESVARQMLAGADGTSGPPT